MRRGCEISVVGWLQIRAAACRGRCRSQPFATKERYGCGSAACRYTSARWKVTSSPQLPVKPVYPAGGQSRPPLQRTGGQKRLVGADDSVGPKNITNSPGFTEKTLCSAGSMRRPQASFEAQPRFARLLGIDPCKRAGRCVRIWRRSEHLPVILRRGLFAAVFDDAEGGVGGVGHGFLIVGPFGLGDGGQHPVGQIVIGVRPASL